MFSLELPHPEVRKIILCKKKVLPGTMHLQTFFGEKLDGKKYASCHLLLGKG